MQIQSEPKGWSDAEVDQLLASVDSIDDIMHGIEQNQANQELALNILTETSFALTTAVFAIVLLISIKIGYEISHYFLPSPRDIIQ